MLRIGMGIFAFAFMIAASSAHAEEVELQICTNWVKDSKDSSTFTCSNGKTYFTNLGLCTTETLSSTAESMIAGIQVVRLFCSDDKSNDLFACSRDEAPDTLACAKEYGRSVASLE